MASETITYELRLDGTKFRADLQQSERKFKEFGNTVKSSASAADKAMDRLHAKANQMNRAFDTSSAKAKRFTGDMGMLSSSLESTAKAVGLPIKNLNELDTIINASSMSFKGLSKSMAGFNTATFGVIGAGLAVGTMIGGWLRQIDAVEKAADKAGEAMFRWVTGMQDTGGTVGPQWQKNIAMVHEAAKKKQMETMRAMGATPDQMKQFFGFEQKKDPMLEQIERLERAQNKYKESQKRALEDLMNSWRQYQSLLKEIEEDFHDMTITTFGTPTTVGSGPMAMYGLDKLEGEGSLAGMDNMLHSGVTRTDMIAAEARQAEINKRFSGKGHDALDNTMKEATEAGFDFTKMMGDVAHAFTLLGVGPNSTLGRLIGTVSVIGGSLDAFKTAQKSGQTGIMGLLGKAVPILGIASAGFSLIKGLFGGGGPSKEEKESARKQAEADRQRIQDAARQMRSQSVDALGSAGSAFFSSRSITNADDARRQGTLFAAAWGQVVKEKGVVAAADAFGDVFKKMSEDMAAKGIDTPEWMKAIGAQMGLGQNEAFRGVAGNAQNAAGFLNALGGSGGLTQDALRAFEQEARAAFEGGQGIALEAGQEQSEAVKAGFGAANPLLRELLNQSTVSGQTLSADIQAMIEEAGITADISVQQLDEARRIRAAVEAMAGGGFGNFPEPAGGGTFRGGPADDGGNVPSFDSGGPVTRTGIARVHEGEFVVPRRDRANMGGNNINITVQASGNKQTDDALVSNLDRTLARMLRSGKGTRFKAAMFDDGFARRGRGR